MFGLILYLLAICINVGAFQCEDLVQDNLYSVKDAFECINSIKVNQSWTSQVQSGLLSLFDTYVFKDILKNPPQPAFDNHFYESIDIDARLRELPLNETSVYKFMQAVQSIINSAHDYHLNFRLKSSDAHKYYYDGMYAVLPFYFDIINNDQVILYANNDLSDYGLDVPEGIKENVNIPVVDINGMDPIAFIRKFADEQTHVKTPHGRFSYAMETMHFISLWNTVIDEKYLTTNINITYENQMKVETGYQILYLPEANRYTPSNKVAVLQRDVVRSLGASPYDYSSIDDDISCLADDSNKMNLLTLKTFGPANNDDFFKVADECFALFDSNDYPITLVLPMNNGGSGDIVGSFEQRLAPHGDYDMIGSVRKSKGMEGCIEHYYGPLISSPQDCKIRYNTSDPSQPLGEWYTSPKSCRYGDVEHVYSQESFMRYTQLISTNLTKHPRKPTELIVMTDGYCYSACSVLTKAMSEQGQAIVVGFEGDPAASMESFDGGNSPTDVIGQDQLFALEDDVNKLSQLGGFMTISMFETFRWNYEFNETIPREFMLFPVDERVPLYHFGDHKVGQFVEEAVNIYKKYQTQCNPKNKRLVKVTDECDSKMTIEHAHGGYLCGDDGKWTSQCVASYCDPDYRFDYYNQKCVPDVCVFGPAPSNDTNEMDSLTKWIIIGVASTLCSLILVVGVIGIVVFIVMKHRQRNSQYTALGN